jgi:hypothetical protein
MTCIFCMDQLLHIFLKEGITADGITSPREVSPPSVLNILDKKNGYQYQIIVFIGVYIYNNTHYQPTLIVRDYSEEKLSSVIEAFTFKNTILITCVLSSAHPTWPRSVCGVETHPSTWKQHSMLEISAISLMRKPACNYYNILTFFSLRKNINGKNFHTSITWKRCIYLCGPGEYIFFSSFDGLTIHQIVRSHIKHSISIFLFCFFFFEKKRIINI